MSPGRVTADRGSEPSGATDSGTDVTQWLLDWSRGDAAALDRLMPVILEDLKRQAASYLRRERRGHTLQPTALVHEVYLRLIDQTRMEWQSRAHFFAVAAQLMRRILVDYARDRGREKRGGKIQKVSLDEAGDVPIHGGVDMLALDRALDELSRLEARQARVVELRFFGGLTIPETAEALDVHTITVSRDWRNAKAWLLCRLAAETPAEDPAGPEDAAD